MSTATLTPPAGGYGDRDDLAAFLATVPAAADYDLAELQTGPRMRHRPARGADKRAAIELSEQEG